MCGGTTGEVIKAVNKQGTRPASFKAFDKYKKDKLDPLTTAGQENWGEAGSDMFKSFEMGMEGIGEFVERNTRSLMPQDEGDETVSDTVSANYSKSSSEKSSKTDKKGKTESKGGTGKTKREFYA